MGFETCLSSAACYSGDRVEERQSLAQGGVVANGQIYIQSILYDVTQGEMT